jgi:hypothetical protein
MPISYSVYRLSHLVLHGSGKAAAPQFLQRFAVSCRLCLQSSIFYSRTPSLRHTAPNRFLLRAMGSDFKGKIFPLLYFLAITFALVTPVISYFIFIGAALLSIIPDRRFIREIKKEHG